MSPQHLDTSRAHTTAAGGTGVRRRGEERGKEGRTPKPEGTDERTATHDIADGASRVFAGVLTFDHRAPTE